MIINTNYTMESLLEGVQSSGAKRGITDESFAIHLQEQMASAGSFSTISQSGEENGQYTGDISIIKEKGLIAYMMEIQAKRLREEILQSMGLTEEALGKMPPEQRAATEKAIAEEIQRRMAAEAMVQKKDDKVDCQYKKLQEIATGVGSVFLSKMNEMEKSATVATAKEDDEG